MRRRNGKIPNNTGIWVGNRFLLPHFLLKNGFLLNTQKFRACNTWKNAPLHKNNMGLRSNTSSPPKKRSFFGHHWTFTEGQREREKAVKRQRTDNVGMINL